MQQKNEKKYKEIENFINSYMDEYFRSPSVREIAKAVDLAVSTTQFYLDKLVEEEKFNRLSGTRGLVSNSNNESKKSVPLLGNVAGGIPFLAIENIEEYISLSKSLLGEGDFFALRVKGDSMKDAGILSNDIVFIKKQNTARNGDIVVALIGEEATLKYFYKDTKNQKIILRPANKDFSDQIYDDIIIQGILVGSYRDYHK